MDVPERPGRGAGPRSTLDVSMKESAFCSSSEKMEEAVLNFPGRWQRLDYLSLSAICSEAVAKSLCNSIEDVIHRLEFSAWDAAFATTRYGIWPPALEIWSLNIFHRRFSRAYVQEIAASLPVDLSREIVRLVSASSASAGLLLSLQFGAVIDRIEFPEPRAHPLSGRAISGRAMAALALTFAEGVKKLDMSCLHVSNAIIRALSQSGAAKTLIKFSAPQTSYTLTDSISDIWTNFSALQELALCFKQLSALTLSEIAALPSLVMLELSSFSFSTVDGVRILLAPHSLPCLSSLRLNLPHTIPLETLVEILLQRRDAGGLDLGILTLLRFPVIAKGVDGIAELHALCPNLDHVIAVGHPLGASVLSKIPRITQISAPNFDLTATDAEDLPELFPAVAELDWYVGLLEWPESWKNMIDLHSLSVMLEYMGEAVFPPFLRSLTISMSAELLAYLLPSGADAFFVSVCDQLPNLTDLSVTAYGSTSLKRRHLDLVVRALPRLTSLELQCNFLHDAAPATVYLDHPLLQRFDISLSDADVLPGWLPQLRTLKRMPWPYSFSPLQLPNLQQVTGNTKEHAEEIVAAASARPRLDAFELVFTTHEPIDLRSVPNGIRSLTSLINLTLSGVTLSVEQATAIFQSFYRLLRLDCEITLQPSDEIGMWFAHQKLTSLLVTLRIKGRRGRLEITLAPATFPSLSLAKIATSTGISKFVVANLEQLQSLECGSQSIVEDTVPGSLTVTNCPELQKADFGAQRLTSFELSGLDSLETLRMSSVEAWPTTKDKIPIERLEFPAIKSVEYAGASRWIAASLRTAADACNRDVDVRIVLLER